MLEGVERRALGSQHRTRIPSETKEGRSMLGAIAVLRELLDVHIWIERFEESSGKIETGNDNDLAAVHLGGKARIGIDRSFRSHVPAAPEIFGQHAADELLHVELLRKRHSAALVAAERRRQDQRQDQCAGSAVGTTLQI